MLTYLELLKLVESGVVQGSSPRHVNAASIDVHLANDFIVEDISFAGPIDVAEREHLSCRRVSAGDEGFLLSPGQFVLASTKETFNLPSHTAALFVMKSSVARCGLDQMNAAWCSPGWHGSTLTLELINATRNHTLLLRPGMAIGQMVFFYGIPVPPEGLYSGRGAYNNVSGASGPRTT